MKNQALYLKHRPARFQDLTGQDPVVTTLTRALDGDRVAHAYMFTGPRGTGKTTTARLLAKGINCLGLKKGEPDNTCENCLAITAGRHLDVLEIDAASNRGIDEIRELRDKVQVAPTRARRKVYIIDEVHMLTKEAFNALLKTLEEPPDHVTFILATTEPHKVPQTIMSRCQRFDFRPASVAAIAGHLAIIAKTEGIKLQGEAADMIARQARGSFRDSLSILDLLRNFDGNKVTVELVREVLGLADLAAVATLERALVTGNAGEALGIIQQASDQGVAAETFRSSLIDYLRNLMLAKAGVPIPGKAAELAADWSGDDLIRAVETYLEVGDYVHTAAIAELPLELATMKFIANRTSRERTEPALAQPSTTPPSPSTTTTTKPSTKDLATKPADRSNPGQPPTVSADDAKRSLDKVSHADVSPEATKLWEDLLVATKDEYSLSLCLQKTRPQKLTKDEFRLGVQSEFFLKKLKDDKTKQTVESLAAKSLGRPIAVVFTQIDAEPDIVDAALKIFEGSRVE